MADEDETIPFEEEEGERVTVHPALEEQVEEEVTVHPAPQEEVTVHPAPQNQKQVEVAEGMGDDLDGFQPSQPLQPPRTGSTDPHGSPQSPDVAPRAAFPPEQLANEEGDNDGDEIEEILSPAGRKSRNDARVSTRVPVPMRPRGCTLDKPLRVTFQVARPLDGQAVTTVPLVISNIKRMCELAGIPQPNMRKGDELASRLWDPL